ncbi:uncharacterized protein N7525_008883 [Penicillium rubens]|uniref:uncharacterized protein n=1 Tax=Penicillium rubens TaxID=1108849 RepID=UPI002A5A49D1|nr:uncharacterized protein N7525_008883 [Penicillium rubens]KAJ5830630.1 hypothetical protein N7525_008883 [Penicillium rubens]KAJ5854211.1 hypothetical protein N7534_006754 [Penicillium rubens]
MNTGVVAIARGNPPEKGRSVETSSWGPSNPLPETGELAACRGGRGPFTPKWHSIAALNLHKGCAVGIGADRG